MLLRSQARGTRSREKEHPSLPHAPPMSAAQSEKPVCPLHSSPHVFSFRPPVRSTVSNSRGVISTQVRQASSLSVVGTLHPDRRHPSIGIASIRASHVRAVLLCSLARSPIPLSLPPPPPVYLSVAINHFHTPLSFSSFHHSVAVRQIRSVVPVLSVAGDVGKQRK